MGTILTEILSKPFVSGVFAEKRVKRMVEMPGTLNVKQNNATSAEFLQIP